MTFSLACIAFSTANFSSETENTFEPICSLSPYNPYPIKHNVLNSRRKGQENDVNR